MTLFNQLLNTVILLVLEHCKFILINFTKENVFLSLSIELSSLQRSD